MLQATSPVVEQRTAARAAFRKKMLNPFAFRLFSITKIPMLTIAGVKLTHISDQAAVATVPFRWLTQNPFRSTYFACQAMAAELTCGSLALQSIQGFEPSVAVIITNMEAQFLKKATGLVTFTCAEGDELFSAAEEAYRTGEGISATVLVTGKMNDGTVVSTFQFTWSFKARRKT